MSKCKFKVGDKVIGNKKAEGRYNITTEGWIGTVTEVYEHCFKAQERPGKTNFTLSYDCFDLIPQGKIVITHAGKTTTATLYHADGTKEKATARCAPEDTFDFKVGAEIAMNRLIGKPTGSEKTVKEQKYNVGDRIFAEDNINRYPGGAWGTVVSVLNKSHHIEDYQVRFDEGGVLCCHVVPVNPVPTAPEPSEPKYYNGKMVCAGLGDCLDREGFIVGKVYEVVDGRFKDEQGFMRPMTDDRVKDPSDFMTPDSYFYNWYKFIPLVE